MTARTWLDGLGLSLRVLLAGLAGAAACAGVEGDDSDSNTNWVKCEHDEQCPAGYACVGIRCVMNLSNANDTASTAAPVSLPEAGAAASGAADCSGGAVFPPGGCVMWPDNEYGKPLNNACIYSWWTVGCVEYANCSIGCEADDDCPLAPGGFPSVRCVEGWCTLGCEANRPCPPGMDCVSPPHHPEALECWFATDRECPYCDRSPECSNW